MPVPIDPGVALDMCCLSLPHWLWECFSSIIVAMAAAAHIWRRCCVSVKLSSGRVCIFRDLLPAQSLGRLPFSNRAFPMWRVCQRPGMLPAAVIPLLLYRIFAIRITSRVKQCSQ